LGVAGDLLVVHASRGRFDRIWADYAERFCRKFGLGTISPPPPPQLLSANLNHVGEVQAFFARFAAMDAGFLDE